jgi:hypothetical protein
MATLATSPLRVKNGHTLIVPSQTRLLRKKLGPERARSRAASNVSLDMPWQRVRASPVEQELLRIVQIIMQPAAAAIKHRS